MAQDGKRKACPVCEGVEMQQLHPSEELELTLDYCERCGGMWFESGEVRQLRYCPPEVLSGLISMKKQLFAVECPSCEHSMTRNAAVCPACGAENIIACPACGSDLERVQGEQFTVDVCQSCRGVWFDNIDLSAVWNLQFNKSPEFAGEGKPPKSDGEITEDTVIAVLRSKKGPEMEVTTKQPRNVFATIADIVGGVLHHRE